MGGGNEEGGIVGGEMEGGIKVGVRELGEEVGGEDGEVVDVVGEVGWGDEG